MNNSTTWLWQTCRLIASPTRLGLLQEIEQNPEQCVGALAACVEKSPSAISTQLRMLCDAGLIEDHRSGQQVYYQMPGDRVHSDILKLNNALKKSFSEDIPYSKIMRQATGCTHWRRIELLQLLAGHSLHMEELGEKTVMAPSALLRHMGKLEARAYVSAKGKIYGIGQPAGHVAKALLEIILPS